jgi:glycosyltransferase involved in cell wall biosynthesis
MAGTSQKLNGYFVTGIPSIVPNTPDFISFVEQYGTSKLVDVSDPGSIAQAVNSFLGDTEEYERYSKNVRKAFESEFNFEKQFEPVFKWLNSLKVK